MNDKIKNTREFINELFSTAELIVVRLVLLALLILGAYALVMHAQ